MKTKAKLPSWCANPKHSHEPHINNSTCTVPKLTKAQREALGIDAGRAALKDGVK